MNTDSFLKPPLGKEFPKFTEKVLVTICSYRGGINNPDPFSFVAFMPWTGPLARLLDRLTFLNLRRFVAQNRNFFANIRPVEYQISLLEEALRVTSTHALEIRIDKKLAEASVQERLRCLGDTKVVSADQLFASAENFGSILIVYPDALGLGWNRAERQLTSNNVYILNGRRRLFPLNASTRPSLFWRRLLANTRLPEMLAGVLVLPLAAGCALLDACRKKA